MHTLTHQPTNSIVENVNALAYSLVVSELRSAEALRADKDKQTSKDEQTDKQTDKDRQTGPVDDERDHPLFKEWTFAPGK